MILRAWRDHRVPPAVLWAEPPSRLLAMFFDVKPGPGCAGEGGDVALVAEHNRRRAVRGLSPVVPTWLFPAPPAPRPADGR